MTADTVNKLRFKDWCEDSLTSFKFGVVLSVTMKIATLIIQMLHHRKKKKIKMTADISNKLRFKDWCEDS